MEFCHGKLGETLPVFSLELHLKFLGWGISSHDQNGWAYTWLTRARMIILMTPSVSAGHFTHSSILKL